MGWLPCQYMLHLYMHILWVKVGYGKGYALESLGLSLTFTLN